MMIRPRHRPLAEDLARARRELDRNPTITRYAWVDGREIRQRVEPWLGIRRSLQQLRHAFITITPDLVSFGEALQRALAAMPAPPDRPVGLGALRKDLRQLSVAPSLSEPPAALFAMCVNCRTTGVESLDGGKTWTHVPSHEPRCWLINPLVDNTKFAEPWPQGGDQ